ncbi:hypothetical protein FC50_GL002317 [Lacticaseibacillus pantheris DSM 15945 = JCM 12539 = NBRC 106106]|uniref:HTH tetR-type domain-containing protein n=2 Tax=Lacticaseibacillus pantheris TaxID=171523 RepID=A0A0R1UCX1_9LACO|nr:hypothetical protein FC50_GL002317 [Lacticaseibacillus pantheris DSM 15945 = JCM 12539 = NBRC 106106]
MWFNEEQASTDCIGGDGMATEYTREQQAFSRECIQEGLFLLMEDQPLDEITVSAISQRSGISRMGFYRNYKSKQDVLDDYFSSQMDHLIDQLADIEPLNAEHIIPRYFEFVRDHSARFRLAIVSGGDQILHDAFARTVGKFFDKNVKRPWFTGTYAEFWQSFVTSGLYAVTVRWIGEDFTTPIPVLTSVVAHLAAQPPRDISDVAINSTAKED